MAECNSSDNRNIELILLGIVAGGFFTYLLTRLLLEIEFLRIMTMNNQYLYQQPSSYQLQPASPMKVISPPKQIFTVNVDEEGLIKHNDIDN